MSEAAPDKLWGAPAIAKALSLSSDAVYRLAEQDETPIYKPPGSNRLFAFRSELMRWLRTKPKKTEET